MKKIYSVRDASELMGISEQRIRKLLSEGRIEAIKVGNTWGITKLDFKRKKRGYHK